VKVPERSDTGEGAAVHLAACKGQTA
jgi:hypothetical protein